MPAPVIVWFRQDLRLADNPALAAAAATGAPIFAIYIHDDDAAGEWRPGSASRWWLRQSLASLNDSLNGTLRLFYGEALEIIPELVRELGARNVFWNRCVEPWRVRRDDEIKERLRGADVSVRTFNGSWAYDPAETLKNDGTPYRVFTPFYRNGCLKLAPAPRHPLAAPDTLALDYESTCGSFDLEPLLPAFPWFDATSHPWRPGEEGALATLQRFLKSAVDLYAEQRDRPDIDGISRLSPHLHFGEISPNQVRQAVLSRTPAVAHEAADKFLAELGWRDFSAHLLFHNPSLPDECLQKKFERLPWRSDADLLNQWQHGLTGYPIVDAGMRELLRTGFMHNRVRMIAASFLVKNLQQDWRDGERWFWQRLLDADLANNSASWQWVAGCGADSAPYFRIFNPVAQGRKFDPEGVYVRRFVPELAALPDKFLHAPWEAPAEVLDQAGVALGSDYPAPIVDLASSRQRALDAYAELANV